VELTDTLGLVLALGVILGDALIVSLGLTLIVLLNVFDILTVILGLTVIVGLILIEIVILGLSEILLLTLGLIEILELMLILGVLLGLTGDKDLVAVLLGVKLILAQFPQDV